MNRPGERQNAEPSFDWEAAKQRLARITRMFEELQCPPPERVRQLLHERAQTLARVAAVEPDSKDFVEVVVFQLGDERFAVETRYVREVLRACQCTPVPDAPRLLAGVTNLRGEVLAVLDLDSLFHPTASVQADQHPSLIVLGQQRPEFGILARAASEVAMLRADQIHPSPMSLPSPARDLVRGVTHNAIVVLDGSALLADERLVIDQAD